MKIKLFLLFLIPLFLFPLAKADVHMAYFYKDYKKCIMCEEIQPFIEELENISYVYVHKYEITSSPLYPTENDKIFKNITSAYNSPGDVPIIFVGNEWFYFGNKSLFEEGRERLNESLQELKEFEVENPIKDGELVYPKPVCVLLAYNSSDESGDEISILIKALEENITFIRIDRIDVKYEENRSILEKLRQEATPVAFIGEKSFPLELYNVSLIVEEAKKYAKVGIDFPEGYEGKKICIVFFYSPGCGLCIRLKAKLDAFEKIYPIEVRMYNLNYKKNSDLLLAYYGKYNITKPYNPIIFIGEKYFYLESQMDELEGEIKRWLGTGLSCPDVKGNAAEVAEELFKNWTLPTIIFGGLLDGINPCAFATLIFFIAYLERAKKKAILPVGISFAIAVYIGYFLIGLGLLGFLSVIRGMVKSYLDITIGMLAIALGILSISDFFIVKKGKEAILQLPMFIKKRRGRIIKGITGDRSIAVLAIISFSAGFAISVLEFACTGQIYVPILGKLVAESSTFSTTALIFLIIYNFMFILPLLIILSLFYFGRSSKALGEMQKSSYAYVKLLIGIFLLVLGSFMFYNGLYALQYI